MNDTRLFVRVYREEKDQIRERAKYHGLSISEYVRRQVAGEERRELQARIYPERNVRTNGKA
jgi:Mobilization protein NikA